MHAPCAVIGYFGTGSIAVTIMGREPGNKPPPKCPERQSGAGDARRLEVPLRHVVSHTHQAPP